MLSFGMAISTTTSCRKIFIKRPFILHPQKERKKETSVPEGAMNLQMRSLL